MFLKYILLKSQEKKQNYNINSTNSEYEYNIGRWGCTVESEYYRPRNLIRLNYAIIKHNDGHGVERAARAERYALLQSCRSECIDRCDFGGNGMVATRFVEAN